MINQGHSDSVQTNNTRLRFSILRLGQVVSLLRSGNSSLNSRFRIRIPYLLTMARFNDSSVKCNDI